MKQLLIYVYLAWFRRCVRVRIIMDFFLSVLEGSWRDIYQRFFDSLI